MNTEEAWSQLKEDGLRKQFDDTVKAREVFKSEYAHLFKTKLIDLPVHDPVRNQLMEEARIKKSELMARENDARRQLNEYLKAERLPIECVSCGNLHGWWCRGCGGESKRVGLRELGLNEAEVEDIVAKQFGGCNLPMVPCFVCNRFRFRGNTFQLQAF